MEINIYADIVFVINIIMDFIILLLAGKATKKNIKLIRLFIGSLCMALLYCLVIFLSEFRIYYNIFASLLLIMIGVLISYKLSGLMDFVKLIIMAYIASFMIGGIGIALYYFTNISTVISSMTGFIADNISYKVLAASVCAFYILFKLSYNALQKSALKKQTFFHIKIQYSETEIVLNALVDTGNSLHDPISNAPVIVAEFESIKNFFPDNIKLMFYEKTENNMLVFLENIADSSFSQRIRFIPYSSLGKQNGMLIGFRPDTVELLDNNRHIKLDNVIIGIYNFKLSQDDKYQGLLNPEILTAIKT